MQNSGECRSSRRICSSVVPGLGLQSQQALVPGLEVVAEPDAADTGGTDIDALQPQLVGDALAAVGGLLEAQVEDLLLDGLGDPVEMGVARAPALLDQGRHTADLEGLLDLVEGVANALLSPGMQRLTRSLSALNDYVNEFL